MSEELSRLIGERLHGTPALDAIRQAGRDEFGLTPAEMNGLLAFFVVAATETTSAFIGSAFQLLGMHPDACAAIRADSAWLPPTFDELMRYCAPGGTAVGLRLAAAPVHFDGHAIPQGALLLLDIERAHFDPAVYAEPARFDPRRRGPPHLGFGGGPHACLGMAAAREQILALLAPLVARFDIEPQSTALEWCEKSTMRRLRRLSITLHPRH